MAIFIFGEDDLMTAAEVAAAVQVGLTDQGYTTSRATKLDNLDVAVSSVSGGGSVVDIINQERTTPRYFFNRASLDSKTGNNK